MCDYDCMIGDKAPAEVDDFMKRIMVRVLCLNLSATFLVIN